ncbi:hypothetical protein BH10ACT11_BH10ACT11_20250 [soil metagenome]
MRRGAITTALVALAGLAVAAPLALAAPSQYVPAASKPAERGNVPSDFRRHSGPHWTWYGPRNWIDSQGTNDLIVSSPTGVDYLHYGAGGVICQSSPKSYYDQFRPYLKNSGGFYGKKLRNRRYTDVGKIRRLPQSFYGPYGFRQKVEFAGKRPSGEKIRGEATLDYFAVPNTTSCGQAFSIRSAPDKGFSGAIKTLRKVQQFITFNG